MKKLSFSLIVLVITLAAMFVVGEITVRLFSPSPYMYPRYKYSAQYGFMLFDNVRMEHGFPGRYKFHYSTNKFGCRGRAIEPASSYAKPNVVVLGDSYGFGMGVNDGEEFAAVMGDELQATHNVINLSNPGWGLTQEIRRYFDFGTLYHPEVVVLQFCSNDPSNNFTHRVTMVKDGKFVFKDHPGQVHIAKKFLSRSIIQKSQLYNFFRIRAFNLFQNRVQAQVEKRKARSVGQVTPDEEFYNTLLDQFSARLKHDGVRLIMISVDGHLERYPNIKKEVERLDAQGQLRYIDTIPIVEPLGDYKSKEGHWGANAHRAIAKVIARVVESPDS